MLPLPQVWTEMHFYFYFMTALFKTVSTLTPNLSTLLCLPLLCFYSNYHLLLYYIMFLITVFTVGLLPQNCKPGKSWVFSSPLCPHLELGPCLVVSTHLLPE